MSFENVESISIMLKDRTLVSQIFLDENNDIKIICNIEYDTEVVIKDPSNDESFIV